MRNAIIVSVCCGALLLGAGFIRRVLLAEVPTPVVSALTQEAVIVQPVAPPPSQPAVDREQLKEAMLNQPLDALQAVASASSSKRPVARDTQAPPPPPAVAFQEEPVPSPFQGASKELDYAEMLLSEPQGDLERIRSAYDVFSRCLDQEPKNQRCVDGRAAAIARLFPPELSVPAQPARMKLKLKEKITPAAERYR